MPKYTKELIENLNKLLDSAQSLKDGERDRLLAGLDNLKIEGCPHGNEHVLPMLRGDFNQNLKSQEEAYMAHAETCPVCGIINHLILTQLEKGSWTLDEFRRSAILHLRELGKTK